MRPPHTAPPATTKIIKDCMEWNEISASNFKGFEKEKKAASLNLEEEVGDGIFISLHLLPFFFFVIQVN